MMILNEQSTYYDVLDLPPDASPQEIRGAYLRAKAAYNKDSVALYTLISEDETAAVLQLIEEAYVILSSPEKRRDYDRNHGLVAMEAELVSRVKPGIPKIVSIDRVPPMEDTGSESDLLVPPSTDFTLRTETGAMVSASAAAEPRERSADPFALSQSPPPFRTAEAPELTGTRGSETSGRQIAGPVRRSPEGRWDARADDAINQEIARETDWKGVFLRKVREARRISLEEVADITKISKAYILAIEDENFAKLPAPVYLRGFVIQIAKTLRLPHEQVAAAYMSGYYLARGKSG